MGFIVNTNREFAGDQYKNVLNKDNNQVYAFPINTSDEEIDTAFSNDKNGKVNTDINPNIYSNVMQQAMDEAKITGNNQVIYDARRRQRQTDPFISAIDAGPFGLFANNEPSIKAEREANIKANPTAAFFGNLTEQTFEILSLAGISSSIISPIASKIGFLARGMTPMAIRAAQVGSGEVLPKLGGEVVRKTVEAGASASLLGALYNTVKESAVQGKTLFDDTEGKLEQTTPDLIKIGTEGFKGLGWFPYGVGGAFSRSTALGMTSGALASGGAFYTISKAEGASEPDSLLNMFIGGFLHLASFGEHTPKQREEIITGVQDAIGGYVKAKNGMTEKNNIHQLVGDEFVSKTSEEILAEQQITGFENEGGAIAKIAESPENTKELVKRIADQVFLVETPSTTQEKTISLTQGQTIDNNPSITVPEGKSSTSDVITKLNVDQNGQPLEGGRFRISSTEGKKDVSKTIGEGNTQTNLHGLKNSTIDFVKSFADKHDFNLVITGGSEAGHEPYHPEKNPLAHETGDKVDFRSSKQPDNTKQENDTIKRMNEMVESWETVPNRKLDNAKGYKDPDTGSIFWNEGKKNPHWDVEVKPIEEGKQNKIDQSQQDKQSGKQVQQVQTKQVLEGQTSKEEQQKVGLEESSVSSKESISQKGEKVKKSKAFQRAKEKYSDELKDESGATYSEVQIVDQMAKAFEIVDNNPINAKRIAYGMEVAPEGVRESAISIAYAEKMRETGNIKEYSNATRSRSLRQTERGQEIVLERAASTNLNDPVNFIKQLLQARIEGIGKKSFKFSFKEKSITEKKAFINKVKSESKTIKDKFLDKKKIDIEEAQRIIDSLIC